jgi:hypothetical protein
MNNRQGPKRESLSEAHLRVTNSSRFRVLHGHALELLSRLEATYHVVRSDAFEVLPGLMQSFEHALSPMALTPVVPDAAPVAVAFTSFPSIVIRYGLWQAKSFPVCGCDACDEDAVEQARRLDEEIGLVVAGRFVEEVRIPWFGDARLYSRLGDATNAAGPIAEGWTTFPRIVAHRLTSSGIRRMEWQPWPKR